MCGLELDHFKGKWNVNKTGANANITDNACTTYLGLVFGEPRVIGMSGHAARVANVPPEVDCAAPHTVCTAALSSLPPPVRLEQERAAKKFKPSFETCSAGGKSRRTQATISALDQYVKDAGSTQQVGSAVAAFQHKPTWMAAVSALKKQRITSKDMAEELAKELQVKAGSLRQMISSIKNGHDNRHASDLLLAVKLYITKKYQKKCAVDGAWLGA